ADYAKMILTHCDPQTAVATIQPLTPREMEVLQHLAAGRSNREIGNEMFLSRNTIKAHARRLYAKLDVNSRTQAVARARTLHLLD
ncbi:hypothetical protein MNBD_CHLOROFLEXI01-3775, partial [hydrothermal vent metagenome]